MILVGDTCDGEDVSQVTIQGKLQRARTLQPSNSNLVNRRGGMIGGDDRVPAHQGQYAHLLISLNLP